MRASNTTLFCLCRKMLKYCTFCCRNLIKSDIHQHNWRNHHHCENTTGTPRPSPLALSIKHSLHTMSMPTNVNCFTINIVITFSIFVGQIIGYLPKLLLQIAENSTWQTLRQLTIMGRKQNALKYGQEIRYFF